MQRDAPWLQQKLWRDKFVLGRRWAQARLIRQDTLNSVMGKTVVKTVSGNTAHGHVP
jgi:hypothetical protein